MDLLRLGWRKCVWERLVVKAAEETLQMKWGAWPALITRGAINIRQMLRNLVLTSAHMAVL